ncbi:unnamed protein product [Timema podura]|uniref:Uncharacterized protein n=1 Tax=Timema podura TaxID=61482 RepID=A0ABN7PJB8_TIMPD|nr:unnamed protein product [Timema podura]
MYFYAMISMRNQF